jgi:16S rRNA C1402 (ribose-2'-O) methylase RsmI
MITPSEARELAKDCKRLNTHEMAQLDTAIREAAAKGEYSVTVDGHFEKKADSIRALGFQVNIVTHRNETAVTISWRP